MPAGPRRGDGSESPGGDSQVDSAWTEAAAPRRLPRRPVEVARRLLLAGLFGVALLALWLRWLAAEPHVPARWRVPAQGSGLELVASSDPALAGRAGQRLIGVLEPEGHLLGARPEWLMRSSRWVVDDEARTQQQQAQAELALWLSRPLAALVFDAQMPGGAASAASAAGPGAAIAALPASAQVVGLSPRSRGLWGVGLAAGALGALALLLYLVTVAVLVWRPGLPTLLYAAVTLPQCLNLLLIGAELLPGLGSPAGLAGIDLRLRLLTDATSSAALVHLMLQHPQRLPAVRWLAPLVWAVSVAMAVLAPSLPLPGLC
jgi:hypothetical protein